MNSTAHAGSGAPPEAGDQTEATVRDWLEDYICRPHDLIGRNGAVCPFVSPSLRAGTLEIRIRTVGPAPNATVVADALLGALEEFDLIGWTGSNPALRSLLVVLPDLEPDQYHLLDDAHGEVKPEAVRRGLMIGQFHPACQEPAARNPGFPVNRSPVPLVAIRPMALHDILFLKDRREWFEEYRRRFGSHFKPGRDAAEPLFAELFRKADAEHGVGA